MMPTTIARTKRIANRIRACSGIIASMMNDSSPEDATIIATSAPKLSILCVYSETVAKPPMQPGIAPRSAPMITCPVLVLRRPLKKRPLDSMFNDSIIIIITTTRPVISMELRSASVSMCSMIYGCRLPRFACYDDCVSLNCVSTGLVRVMLFDPTGDEQVDQRAQWRVGGESYNY